MSRKAEIKNQEGLERDIQEKQIIESVEVQETKQAWLKSRDELDTLSKKISALEGKEDQAKNELEELEAILMNAEVEKSEALAMVAIGEMKDAQFAEIKERHEEIKQRNDYLKELIPAIDHEKGILQNTYGELANRTAELRRFFWSAITAKLKTEIVKLTPAIHRLYIANQFSGGGYLRMGDFLEDRVFGRPTDEQRMGLQQDLIEQYENN